MSQLSHQNRYTWDNRDSREDPDKRDGTGQFHNC